MNSIVHQLSAELADLIAVLGNDGGLIGPSVYDTAQLLRFAPPANPEPALNWLRSQQYADGGWGDPAVPNGRDIATLAAVLALQPHVRSTEDQAALTGALHFLRAHIPLWQTPGEDIPLAAELLLPWLVSAAHAQGLPCHPDDYAELAKLGNYRRGLIARIRPKAATPPLHSWEAWGEYAEQRNVDSSGGVGHSPAATAAWFHSAAYNADLADERAAAQRYLQGAAYATGVGIEGVVPTVWPYGRNEQLVSLYTLLLAGVLDHPALQASLAPQIANLRHALRPEGYGISDIFQCDGDLTAMAFAVLHQFDIQSDPAILRRYLVDESVGRSCLTYSHELQRSRSATAHAAHALALLGDDATALADYLIYRRDADGRMTGEKWHTTWLYLTGHAMHTFIACGMPEAACAALDGLVAHQNDDGGWGIAGTTTEETAYGVFGLLALAQNNLLSEAGQEALHRAGSWLLSNYRPGVEDLTERWTAKQLYCPRRIARVEELGATLACALGGWGEMNMIEMTDMHMQSVNAVRL
jgi:hypothetical protein